MSEAPQPQFNIQRVYLKDLSFESPASPETFRKEWKPETKLDMKTSHKELEDGLFEVTLSLTVEAQLEGKTAFLVEVQQAGIFVVKDFPDAQRAHTLGAYCQNILFPYARETIDNVVVKGSFPAVMLAQINFDGIFANAVAKAKEEADAKTETAQ